MMFALLKFFGLIIWVTFAFVLLGIGLALGFVGAIVAAVLILVVGPFVSSPQVDEF